MLTFLSCIIISVSIIFGREVLHEETSNTVISNMQCCGRGHVKYTSHWVSQAQPQKKKKLAHKCGYVQHDVLTEELLYGSDWQYMDNLIRTFFPQQEIQEVVGVGHTHFSLHLRPSQGRVDIARALPLFRLPQLRKPTPHISVIEERRFNKDGR